MACAHKPLKLRMGLFDETPRVSAFSKGGMRPHEFRRLPLQQMMLFERGSVKKVRGEAPSNVGARLVLFMRRI